MARLAEDFGARNHGQGDAGLFFEQGSASSAGEDGFENRE